MVAALIGFFSLLGVAIYRNGRRYNIACNHFFEWQSIAEIEIMHSICVPVLCGRVKNSKFLRNILLTS